MFKRDRSSPFPLEEATWLAADGIRYLRPSSSCQVLNSEVDDHDLDSTLPLLDADAVAFLLDLLQRSDHRTNAGGYAARGGLSAMEERPTGNPRHERSSVTRP